MSEDIEHRAFFELEPGPIIQKHFDLTSLPEEEQDEYLFSEFLKGKHESKASENDSKG